MTIWTNESLSDALESIQALRNGKLGPKGQEGGEFKLQVHHEQPSRTLHGVSGNRDTSLDNYLGFLLLHKHFFPLHL